VDLFPRASGSQLKCGEGSEKVNVILDCINLFSGVEDTEYADRR
jgi:hypothetical protein